MSPEFLVALGEIEKHFFFRRSSVDDRHVGQSYPSRTKKVKISNSKLQRSRNYEDFFCILRRCAEDFSRKLKVKR